MRAVTCLALCLGSTSAYAQPVDESAEATADPTIVAFELAGTWSGKTNEPKNGWRAALLVPVETATVSRGVNTITGVALVARYDDHGAPAESGTAETNARSCGAGLRTTMTWASANWQLGVFGEGTVGQTRARHADVMTSQHDWHWMLSGGFTGGTRSVQLVADFGWLMTDAGDGRIGPIASLGVHVPLD